MCRVSSPCIHLCKLDDRGVCIGCFRTMDEIAAWMKMTEFQKLEVIAALRERSSPTQQVRAEKPNE
jgi:predicted Fe-S protein YdhL (DUF1289 family)